jgi:hypothetical protein
MIIIKKSSNFDFKNMPQVSFLHLMGQEEKEEANGKNGLRCDHEKRVRCSLDILNCIGADDVTEAGAQGLGGLLTKNNRPLTPRRHLPSKRTI